MWSLTQMTLTATATAYVTGHDRSLTSKMTSQGAVWDRSGMVHDRSHTSKMTCQGAVCPTTDWSFY